MSARVTSPLKSIGESDEAADPGHAAWKQAKVKRGLEQASDRATLIPADKVWRELGLEG